MDARCIRIGLHRRTEDGDDPDVHYSSRTAAETAYKNWLQSKRLLTLGDVLECDGDIAKLEEIVKGRL